MSGYVHDAGCGVGYDWHGARVVIKAGSSDTEGRLAVMESSYPPGLSVPEHVHAGEDEMLYVLAGELRGFCGGEDWTARPGSFVFVPRDTPHGFVVTSGRSATAVVIVGPSRLDGDVAATGVPVPPAQPAPQAPWASSDELQPVGWVNSELTSRDQTPLQGDEGAPQAWLTFETSMRPALRDLQVGTDILVFTWLDRARRDTLAVRPRGDARRLQTGVFSTRSPDRPNPIGLHRVTILATEETRLRVSNLEALDRTPIMDVKPVLEPITER